jgi:menaquinone-dependent protoporphyrinogen oxidase
MNSKALVAYGTKHGSTAEIAEAIGETFRARGITTEVAPADAIRSVDDVGLVVVGGGVYVGRWHGAAVDFLKRFDRQLRDRPTWLFGSGPTGGTPKADQLLVEILAEQPPAPGNIAKLAERIGAREYRTFGGRAGPGMGGIFERWVPKGDWRDFDAIREWADRIADSADAKARAGVSD